MLITLTSRNFVCAVIPQRPNYDSVRVFLLRLKLHMWNCRICRIYAIGSYQMQVDKDFETLEINFAACPVELFDKIMGGPWAGRHVGSG